MKDKENAYDVIQRFVVNNSPDKVVLEALESLDMSRASFYLKMRNKNRDLKKALREAVILVDDLLTGGFSDEEDLILERKAEDFIEKYGVSDE